MDSPTEKAQRTALRAALAAAHLLGLAIGTHLRLLRGLKDPLTELQARLEEAELRARLAWEATEILQCRFLVCTNTILNWERVADPTLPQGTSRKAS